MSNQDPILTVKEAAALLKIDTQTMYTWIHIDDFPAVRVGKIIRIPYGLLMDWTNEHAGKTVIP